MSRDLVCREVVELLNGYLDQALPADVLAAVEAHLAGCDGCTMVLEEFRRMRPVGADDGAPLGGA